MGSEPWAACLPLLQSDGLEPVRDWIVSKLPESPSLYPKVAPGWGAGLRQPGLAPQWLQLTTAVQQMYKLPPPSAMPTDPRTL